MATWASPNRDSDESMMTSSNVGPNSLQAVLKVWVSTLKLDIKILRSAGFLSTTIFLAMVVAFIIPGSLSFFFILGWARIVSDQLSNFSCLLVLLTELMLQKGTSSSQSASSGLIKGRWSLLPHHFYWRTKFETLLNPRRSSDSYLWMVSLLSLGPLPHGPRNDHPLPLCGEPMYAS